jgi:hypothetical protein
LLVVLAHSGDRSRTAPPRLPPHDRTVVTKLGLLTINEAKISLRNARQEGFGFLGYSFGPH